MTNPTNAVQVQTLSRQQLEEIFTCQLSLDFYDSPVTETHGLCRHTFSAERIQGWLANCIANGRQPTCPFSNHPLAPNDLQPNQNVAQAVALLDPNRVEPLSETDINTIQIGANDVLNMRGNLQQAGGGANAAQQQAGGGANAAQQQAGGVPNPMPAGMPPLPQLTADALAYVQDAILQANRACKNAGCDLRNPGCQIVVGKAAMIASVVQIAMNE